MPNSFRIPLQFLVAFGFLPSLSAAPPTRAGGDLILKARSILKTYCSECHSGKPEQPSSLNLMNYGEVVSTERPVPAVNKSAKDRSLILEWMTDGSMPPLGRDGKRPRPTVEEIAAVRAWIDAEALPYPSTYDDTYVAEAIVADAETRDAESRLNDRYITFKNLVRDGVPWSDLTVQLQLTIAAMERATAGGKGKLNATTIAADPAAIVFRLDLRSLGWDSRDLFENVVVGQRGRESYEGTAGVTLHDLLLLEAPDAPPAVNEDLQRRLTKVVLEPQKLLRPLPSLRGEWLAKVLTEGGELTQELQTVAQLAGKPTAELPTPAVRFREAIPREEQPVPALESLFGSRDRTSAKVDRFKISLQQPIGSTTRRIISGEAFIMVADNFDIQSKPLRAILVDRAGAVSPQPLFPASLVTGVGQKIYPNNTNKVGFLRYLMQDPETKPIESFVLFTSKDPLPEMRIIRSRHAGERHFYRYFFVRKSLWDDEARLATASRYVLQYTIVDSTKKGP